MYAAHKSGIAPANKHPSHGVSCSYASPPPASERPADDLEDLSQENMLVWRREGDTFDCPATTSGPSGAVGGAAAGDGEIESARNVVTLAELNDEFAKVRAWKEGRRAACATRVLGVCGENDGGRGEEEPVLRLLLHTWT